MNSFAVWYDGSSKENHNIELHFNLWKLKNKISKIYKKENSNMFLDIGIKVENIDDIEKVHIFIPFPVTSENIEDMGIKMKDNRKLINGIFNDDCEIKHNGSKNGVTISRDNGNDVIKIHTLDYEYQKNISVELKDNGSIISIDTKKDKRDKKESSYYRFRIKGKPINDFGKTKEDLDNPFKTSYESNHIIDFRVNEKRALPENLNMLLQKEKLFNIKVIHFLLLMDISYKLACTGLDYSMRALEDNLWSEYLDNEYETGCLVGYHWKSKVNEIDKGIENFNSYIRIKEVKINIITILIYVLGVMIIGVITSLIAGYLQTKGFIVSAISICIFIILWGLLIYSNLSNKKIIREKLKKTGE